jgi:UDP-N-acetylmuramoylalanine--D-glutamate ligase
MHKIFSGTKALVVILGVHGGGVANAKWLLRHGAKVMVTDMRTKTELAQSLARFTAAERGAIQFVLGGQREEDFRRNDLILLGPGVQKHNPWRNLALNLGKRVENDASLFFRYALRPSIAVTGTRGKTTTTRWIAELLSKRYPDVRVSGNTPENPLLREIDRRATRETPHVVECSSWQLELAPRAERSARVAVITNLYRDHLNTYDSMEDYADAKANIFACQGENDTIILNYQNDWTRYFLRKRPRGRVRFFSIRPLPKTKEGIFVRGGYAYIREGKDERRVVRIARFAERFGEHNVANVLAAMLAVRTFDPTWRFMEKEILALRPPKMRQEILYDSRKLRIVNDSTATSPDGVIAALKRFSRDSRVLLIAGGTDKALEFTHLAREIRSSIPPKHLILLAGTATKKILAELKKLRYEAPEPKESLEKCVEEAFARAKSGRGKSTILFSPGAASFGMFLHEFDRGERFAFFARRVLRASARRGGKRPR